MRWVPRGEPKVGEPLGGDMAGEETGLKGSPDSHLRPPAQWLVPTLGFPLGFRARGSPQAKGPQRRWTGVSLKNSLSTVVSKTREF